MKTTYLTWRFKTDHYNFGRLEKLLVPDTKRSWFYYSTERPLQPDWLGADIGGKAELRFYLHYKGIFDAVLKVASDDVEHDECVVAARHRVLTEILTIVGAREVEEIETIYRY
ncbi:hypothetical protein [Haliangium sp. UPWRP_2]|uniref:hypothetical protein n=1 Tax=Haliangium sp. UPWRP_2 TaxID=1931276 RepID=UPI000D0DAB6C|nr:hypothetical protein [Haliangium sp. UPWRP_2]PSM31731.1 hypothetical protein BVG81_003945 [Haliangium sp. UPWRP_2]